MALRASLGGSRAGTSLALRRPPSSRGTARSQGLRCVAHNALPDGPSRRAVIATTLAFGLSALAPLRLAAAAADSGAAAPSPAQQGPQQGSAVPAPAAVDGAASQTSPAAVPVPLTKQELEQLAAQKLLEEEEERRKSRRRKKGRIRELEEIRAELAEKELVLLGKEAQLLEKEQTLVVLREELDIEKKLRALLTKEKEKAEEEAALAMGLCTGGSMLP